MGRQAADFYDIRGDIAFINGIYTIYVEEILEPVLKKDPMPSLKVDFFSLGDYDELRADKALSDQVKKYLEIGHFDKDGNFTPLPSHDDFTFPLEENLHEPEDGEDRDELLRQALIRFLEDSCENKEELVDAAGKFVYAVHAYLCSSVAGVYKPDHEVIKQLQQSVHYHMILAGALFLVFGSGIMLITIGYDD